MIRTFTRPIPLVLALAFCTFVPVMMAAVSVVQIPLGALPEDSLRLASFPVAFFLHSLAGVLFGVLGPLQFVHALRFRFGTLHRLTGRVFVLSGLGLGLSGLALLLQVESIATGLLDAARGVFGLALIAALVLGVAAARAHMVEALAAIAMRCCGQQGGAEPSSQKRSCHDPHVHPTDSACSGPGLLHLRPGDDGRCQRGADPAWRSA